jgi:DNA-binding CsgD family transcriptional regulator
MHLKSNHIFYESSAILRECIINLKKYNIQYFDYHRCYNDGGRIYLGTHAGFLKHYLDNKLYLQGNMEAEPKLYEKQAFLWSTLPNQDIFQCAREYDIDNGIFLVFTKANYNEYFAFAGSRKHFGLINFYLNNLDLLERFCVSFKDQARSLIKTAKKNRIILPYHRHGLTSYNASPSDKFEGSYLTQELSKKQIECSHWLLTGASAKEIGLHMKISYRTVEDYIDILKQKLLVRNKSELILKLRELHEKGVIR